ncbi:MAG: Tim44 domain-containing protein [Methylocystis sp.]|nr:Tim44 domain-containing protein [Methylocystis sp.]MBI3275466.1 Tim44 domain-containing protein [Methylocystis sp.]
MSSTRAHSSKPIVAFGLALLLALAPALAQAKMGGGMSSGSRGSRTFSAPPPTTTAPRPAAPMERSVTPQNAPSFGQAPQAARPGLFGGGFGGGLLGGLLGAGLFGLLLGHGLFGGVGGVMSIIGLVLQLALLYFVVRLAFNWFTGRGVVGAARPSGAGAAAFSGGPGLGLGGGAAQRQFVSSPLTLSNEDFPAFERLLSETQSAYSREDHAGLRALVTDEMASYFGEEIAANARKGLVNRISGVKLLQGDLSEAWREGADEYATVAMRFALIDVMEDKASGKLVSGDPAQPTQATEIWTFRRPAGAGPNAWKLSAIQQTG